MCGAIHTECEVEGCSKLVKYENICITCENNLNYPTGV